jgi:hypothetical protein
MEELLLMDGYFVAPPTPVTLHAAHVPTGVPQGNGYQVNHVTITNFWSVRDLWFEDVWFPQSEGVAAASIAQVQPPVAIPHESTMTPVVMISW